MTETLSSPDTQSLLNSTRTTPTFRYALESSARASGLMHLRGNARSQIDQALQYLLSPPSQSDSQRFDSSQARGKLAAKSILTFLVPVRLLAHSTIKPICCSPCRHIRTRADPEKNDHPQWPSFHWPTRLLED